MVFVSLQQGDRGAAGAIGPKGEPGKPGEPVRFLSLFLSFQLSVSLFLSLSINIISVFRAFLYKKLAQIFPASAMKLSVVGLYGRGLA